MKMIFLSYNVCLHEEVLEKLNQIGVDGYTCFAKVLGKGKSSGYHLDNTIWPGVNSALLIAVEEEKAQKVFQIVQDFRKSSSLQGIKAFMWSLEEIS
ncbi:MAG: hypothetical protein HUU50_21485 [Candidatus Brocadiae bacterium]|nr:hypothetical protein [Candidatus Brocadiia bacterium]